MFRFPVGPPPGPPNSRPLLRPIDNDAMTRRPIPVHQAAVLRHRYPGDRGEFTGDDRRDHRILYADNALPQRLSSREDGLPRQCYRELDEHRYDTRQPSPIRHPSPSGHIPRGRQPPPSYRIIPYDDERKRDPLRMRAEYPNDRQIERLHTERTLSCGRCYSSRYAPVDDYRFTGTPRRDLKYRDHDYDYHDHYTLSRRYPEPLAVPSDPPNGYMPKAHRSSHHSLSESADVPPTRHDVSPVRQEYRPMIGNSQLSLYRQSSSHSRRLYPNRSAREYSVERHYSYEHRVYERDYDPSYHSVNDSRCERVVISGRR